MTALLIDVGVIGIIAFCAWRGYKNGLIRGVFGVFSLIVALLLANIAAQAYADDAKDMMMPFVSGIIESTFTEMAGEDIDYQALVLEHGLDDVDIDFDSAYAALRQLGIPESAARNIAEQAVSALDLSDGPILFHDIIAEQLTRSLSFIAVFGITFLLISIAFAVIGNLISLVFSLPGLKLVDTIAGSALGLFKGVIIVYTLAVVIRYFGLLMLPTLESTTILNAIVKNNPIANIFGI
ncbi:MAG: CvpA family protein [Oscillospiraceae bacterium]|jgi:uncharacterized membrane protein required for colicin V production|nr:CvpA family protein [Oscillospiraceae bacterium]